MIINEETIALSRLEDPLINFHYQSIHILSLKANLFSYFPLFHKHQPPFPYPPINLPFIFI